ncbi:hypothetical protein ACFR99_13835 [Haloarchaeobius amylolyticus]|uniref:Uncharacterized protein n=1 Tax=Haloarchaeobius amylolyticus TaxID=1198296 RepID=A0ABD6BHS5_9EURY
MEYYDRLLGSMLAALLAGVVVGFHPALDFYLGLLGGALVATLFLWDAIVRRPPVPRADPTYTTAVVVWHGGVLAMLGLVL